MTSGWFWEYEATNLSLRIGFARQDDEDREREPQLPFCVKYISNMSDEKTNLAATILRALTDVGIVRRKSAKFLCKLVLLNRTGLLI